MADDDSLKSLQNRLKGWTHVFETIERNTETRRPDYKNDHNSPSPICLDHRQSDTDLARKAPTSSSSRTLTAQCSNYVSHTVLYDYDAQSQLAEMVKNVCLTASELRRSSRQELKDMDVKLQPVAELCEKMAYQLLLDGGCQPHLRSIIQVLEDMARACQKENYTSNESLANFEQHPQASPVLSAKMCPVNVTSLESEANEDDGDDESEQEITLASVRLTSRLKAK